MRKPGEFKILRRGAAALVCLLVLPSLVGGAVPEKPLRGKDQDPKKPVLVMKSPTRPQESKTGSTDRSRLPQRDPFRSLAARSGPDAPLPMIAGKRGLFLDKLQIRGIILAGDRKLAVVESPQTIGAFFLKPNDEIYDGRVVAIEEGSVVFEEHVRDPQGKVTTRNVVKRIAGTGGANQ